MAGFKDIVGNEQIIEHLQNAISMGKVSHAYIINGPQLSGKMMIAEAFARALQCEKEGTDGCGECKSCHQADDHNHPDIIYVSHEKPNNISVDDIRTQLNNDIVIKPYSSKYKIYIVDEAEKMNQQAQNALLKTLEEPPAHVVFILATTELQKLPATIISRCQRFDFRRIATDAIVGRLLYIAGQENIPLTDGAARILAKHAAGGMRDAISLLDLCSSGGATLDEAYVTEALGINSAESLYALVRAIHARDYEQIFEFVRTVAESSVDLAVSWQDLLALYRDLLVVKTAKRPALYLDATEAETKELAALAALYTSEELLCHLRLLDDALSQMQRSGSTKRTIAEMTLIKLCDPRLSDDPSAMLARIAAAEEKIARLSLGIPDAPSPAPAEKTEKVKDPVPANATAPVPEKPEPLS